MDRKFDIGSALTESSQQPSDGSGYRCWALLACSSLQPGGQPRDFMGPLVQVNALRSSCGIFHRMTSLCVGKHLPFRQLKKSFSPLFTVAGDFSLGMSRGKLVYRIKV